MQCSIDSKLDQLLDQQQDRNAPVVHQLLLDDDAIIHKLPIENQEELLQFENKLQTEPEFRLALVNFYYTILSPISILIHSKITNFRNIVSLFIYIIHRFDDCRSMVATSKQLRRNC